MSFRIVILDTLCKEGKDMAQKEFGRVAVFTAEQYIRQDNTVGYKISALTDEESPRIVVFYKDGSEGEPKKGDNYNMVLGIDSRFKAVVRFERC